MGKIIGIDLGTTNSAMSVMEAGTPAIIPNAEGRPPQEIIDELGGYDEAVRIIGDDAANDLVKMVKAQEQSSPGNYLNEGES